MIGEDFRGKDCCNYVFLGTDLRDAKVENADLSQSFIFNTNSVEWMSWQSLYKDTKEFIETKNMGEIKEL